MRIIKITIADNRPRAFWRFRPCAVSTGASGAGFSDACHSAERLSSLPTHLSPVRITHTHTQKYSPRFLTNQSCNSRTSMGQNSLPTYFQGRSESTQNSRMSTLLMSTSAIDHTSTSICTSTKTLVIFDGKQQNTSYFGICLQWLTIDWVRLNVPPNTL